jgi:transposase
VICVETIGKIRRWHRVDKLSISKIAKRLSASRNTIAKYLDGEVTQPRYKQRPKRAPVMGAWVEKLEAMLAADAQRPRKEQRTAQRLLDGLLQEGFSGSYPTVQRFVKAWHETRRHGVGTVFIPQSFAPGEAYQFDWSYEMVDLGGRPTPVKVAHLRLCTRACSWRWRICVKPRRWCSMRTGGRSACGAAAASAGSTISRPRSN